MFTSNHIITLVVGGLIGAGITLMIPSSSSSDKHSDKQTDTKSNGRERSGRFLLSSGGQAPISQRFSKTFHRLYGAVEEAKGEDFGKLADELSALPEDSPRRDALLSLLFERWVEVDPEGALAYAGKLRGSAGDLAYQTALTSLGQSDYQKTLTWINGNMTYAQRRKAQMWLYVGLAKENPSLAMSEIAKLPDGAIKEQSMMNVANLWAQEDVSAAFNWFEGAPWTASMSDIYDSLVSSYLRQDPEGAIEFLEAIPEGSYTRENLTLQLLTNLAGKDSQRSLELAESVTEQEAKIVAYTTVFEHWSEEDPEAAFAEALKMAGDSEIDKTLRNDVTRQAAFALLWEDTSRIKEEYTELPEDIRQEIVGPFVSEWLTEDEDAARAWIKELPTDGAEYNIALNSMVKTMSKWKPEESISLAKEIEFPDVRDDSIYSSLKNLYRQNPERAIEVANDSSIISSEMKSDIERWIAEFGEAQTTLYLPQQ